MRLHQFMTSRTAYLLTHPAWLLLASVTSILLWMPFGFGYYPFPWDSTTAVCLLLIFVALFPACAALSLARSYWPKFSLFRFILSTLFLLVSLLGLAHMLHWWHLTTHPAPINDPQRKGFYDDDTEN